MSHGVGWVFFFRGKIGDLLIQHSVDPGKMSHFLTSGHETWEIIETKTQNIVFNKNKTQKKRKIETNKYPEVRQSNVL